jgi:hypothetical protein
MKKQHFGRGNVYNTWEKEENRGGNDYFASFGGLKSATRTRIDCANRKNLLDKEIFDYL